MKRIFIPIAIFLIYSLGLVQMTDAQTRNFVRTWVATAPETSPTTLMGNALKEVKESTVYFDGLGRPEQTVAKKGSLSSSGNTDLVTPAEYDVYGREIFKYMPYIAGTNDGSYKSNAIIAQGSYNSTFYSSQSENNFYTQTDYEPSPASRVLKVIAPGVNWAGSNRGVQTLVSTYETEGGTVRKWTVTDVSNDFGTYSSVSGQTYGNTALYIKVTTDENGNQVWEYIDWAGLTVVKKVWNTPSTYLMTLYIYDDLNRLRCVVQPAGTAGFPSTATLDEYCFRYEYDEKNRMIMKKVPGAAPVYMVYDTRDRLVFTQDGNLRANNQNQWLTTLYDNYNRIVLTGITTYNGTQTQIQSIVNTQTQTPLNPNTGIAVDLVLNGPINSSPASPLQAIRSITLDDNFMTADGITFTAEIVNGEEDQMEKQQL